MEERSGVRNRRINSADEEDRISALPDSVIQHILTFLPSTKTAIRTSILSKRWQYHWTHVPVLIFKRSAYSGIDYFRFIENTLILHDCPKIKKFHLEYGHDYIHVDETDFDHQLPSKIRFAIRRCVEELSVICHDFGHAYLLPEILFDCASLVKLEIANCRFKPNWRVNWPSLKSLKVSCDDWKDNCSEGIENVVSGSPLLECFEFRGYMLDGVAIVSKSLKVLSFVDAQVPKTLKISCPNLVEFNLVLDYWQHCHYSEKMIENVLLASPIIHSLKLVNCNEVYELVIASKSLKVLHLERLPGAIVEVSCPNLEKLDMLLRGDEIVNVVNPPSPVLVNLDSELWYTEWGSDDPFKKLLEPFQHAEKLTMGRVFFKKYASELFAEGYRLPQLNSKCLTLVVGKFILAIPGIAYALHSPRLETLVIKLTSEITGGRWCRDEEMSDKELQDLMISRSNFWNTHGSSGLTCLVSQLTMVEIIGMYETEDKCKFELEFIEFLLKNAQVLKKVTVSLEKSTKDFASEFSQKLLSFPRYSRRANVELLCST